MQRAFRYLLIAVALISVTLASAILTMKYAIHGAEVQVPSLIGFTLPEATQRAEKSGLGVTITDRYYSTEVAAGRVLLQSPEAGVVVRRNWTLRVIESLGPQKIAIPDVIGMDQRSATLAIRKAGLDVGTIATLPVASAKSGTVLAQDPPGAALGVARPRVSILLAGESSAQQAGFVLPSWIGLPAAQASAAASDAGLHVGSLQYADKNLTMDNNGRPGVILSQHPLPGSRVLPGEQVQFVIAH